MSALTFLEFIAPKIISEDEEDEAPVSEKKRALFQYTQYIKQRAYHFQ